MRVFGTMESGRENEKCQKNFHRLSYQDARFYFTVLAVKKRSRFQGKNSDSFVDMAG
jgi:hypothetical protein